MLTWPDSVRNLAILPNGDLVSGSNQIITIWSVNDYSIKQNITAHSTYTNSLSVLPNGDLVSGSYDYTFKIWNTNNGSEIKSITNLNFGYYTFIVLPTSDLACASGNNIIILNLNDASIKKNLTGHIDLVDSLSVLPNGDLVSGSDDYTIRIWDTDNGTVKKVLTWFYNQAWSMAFLPNGYLVCSFTQNISIWNLNDDLIIQNMTSNLGDIYNLVVLTNGDIAFGFSDGTIVLWSENFN